MAHTLLIWDHRTVRVWRTSRSSASLVQEGEAQDLTALLALLDRAEETSHFGRLLVYLDIPALDHHIERVPKMAPKLQQQLLVQRKLKLYGDEKRSLASTEMGLQGEATAIFISLAACRMKSRPPLVDGRCATVCCLMECIACRMHLSRRYFGRW